MDSLFPYSSVVPAVEKCLVGEEGDVSGALSTLSALLRHVPYRSDLFPILASLTSCNKLKVKLAAYQLALRNRDDEQLILLFNQALKVFQIHSYKDFSNSIIVIEFAHLFAISFASYKCS